MITPVIRTKPEILTTAVAVALGLSVVATAAADVPYRGDGSIMLEPAQLEWMDIKSMAAPAQIAVIEGKLSAAEPFTFRLKLPAGYRIEPHVHPEYERVTVLSGTLHFAHGETFDREKTRELPSGGVAIMAPGEPMYGYTEEDTVIQLHGTGPWGIRYIDPANDPRS